MSSDTAVKLESLSIKEASGVDDPANELPGWMVMKAAGPSHPIGPDQAWDVGAADKRVREATGATDAPNSSYAACFLFKSGDGTKYGDYKFLVCDVVDGKIMVMPQAIRAAASRVSGSSLSSTEKSSVQAKIDALEKKAGIGAEATKSSEEATSILRKVKDLIFPTSTNGEEFDNMTNEEFAAALADGLKPLTEQVEELQKSVTEAAPTVETAPSTDQAPTTEAAPSAEELAKMIGDGISAGVEKALEPYNEILEKVLDRIEGLEKNSITRKSLDGQEGVTPAADAPSTPTLADAIVKAFKHLSSAQAVAEA